jgi:hypothetical protein
MPRAGQSERQSATVCRPGPGGSISYSRYLFQDGTLSAVAVTRLPAPLLTVRLASSFDLGEAP